MGSTALAFIIVASDIGIAIDSVPKATEHMVTKWENCIVILN